MLNILSVNCGSSSLKYQLIDMDTEQVLAKGLIERIGVSDSIHKQTVQEKTYETTASIPDHEHAVQLVLQLLVDKEFGAIEKIEDIAAIGHRVVHGGERFSDSVLISEEVIEEIQACIELAPLHNPPNLVGIQAFRKALPNVPAAAVFDTAFHQTMPPSAYLYSLPYEYYKQLGIRKYGFHGTSHKYVSQRAAEILGKPLEQLRLISCHLGNGSSVTAIKNGKSIDTSMGFTPLAGVTMGTRSGDLDPAVIPFLMEKTGKTAQEVIDILNKQSGLLGISGISNDLRDIESAAAHGEYRSQLALDICVDRIRDYIGSYAVALQGVDAIVFTAGIGENSSLIRERVLEGLDFMGIHFDPSRNAGRGKEMELTTPESPVKALVIPTNEELMIARETVNIINL